MNRYIQNIRNLLNVRYEVKIRLTLAFVFLIIVLANLNSIRFFQQTGDLNSHNSAKESFGKLEFFSQLLKNDPNEVYSSKHFRELIRASGFDEVYLIESRLLLDDADYSSNFLDSLIVARAKTVFSYKKEIYINSQNYLPAAITEMYHDNGYLERKALFYHFGAIGNSKLSLIGIRDAHLDAGFNRFKLLNTIFQLLGIFAAIIIAVILLRITFEPYRKIKSEAIAAQIANPDQPEAVDFAVETFHKVIEELKAKEKRLSVLYAQEAQRSVELERWNSYILKSMPSGVISCDRQGTVVHYNDVAMEILKIPREEVLEQKYSAVFTKFKFIIRLFNLTLEKHKKKEILEREIKISENKKILVGLTSIPLYNQRRQIRGALILITDLTEINRLQEEISFKEKMAELGEMSAGLAHQLRNSLAAVVGYAQLVVKLTSDDKQAFVVSEKILAESKSTEEMLTRFLNYASPGAVQLENCDVQTILSTIEKHFDKILDEQKVDLEFECSENLPEINCDPVLITNCLVNLIQNAREASGDKGKVIIQITCEETNKALVIKVIDHGCGIEKGNLKRIFTPFYTEGKVNGTGLGLALVRKWVLAHNGEITCNSKINTGTTFTLLLPFSENPQIDITDKSFVLKNDVARIS